jgi:lipopolysaccharide/colanic/teichoic acid biosynthesis glycosyltransferase
MAESGSLKGKARVDLIAELHAHYSASSSFKRRLMYWRKKILWIVAVIGAKALKRGVDLTVSAAVFILLSPLFVLIALAIKCTDGGPILYMSRRVGRYGREFSFPKFRTMVVNAAAKKAELLDKNDHGGENVTFKMKEDPRITWIGKIIRRASIDEMPQLITVLLGQMTLVGPRPPLPSEVAQYTLEQRRRLDVVPGITCIWQVSGRGEIPFPRQCELDVKYIQSQSLWVDLKILLKTIPAVLSGRGAY